MTGGFAFPVVLLGGFGVVFPSDPGIPSLKVADCSAHQAMQGGLL